MERVSIMQAGDERAITLKRVPEPGDLSVRPLTVTVPTEVQTVDQIPCCSHSQSIATRTIAARTRTWAAPPWHVRPVQRLHIGTPRLLAAGH